MLHFRGRPIVTAEQLRIFTYVLLGMLLGVITIVLFTDFSKPSKPAPATEQETTKGDSPDESDSTGA